MFVVAVQKGVVGSITSLIANSEHYSERYSIPSIEGTDCIVPFHSLENMEKGMKKI